MGIGKLLLWAWLAALASCRMNAEGDAPWLLAIERANCINDHCPAEDCGGRYAAIRDYCATLADCTIDCADASCRQRCAVEHPVSQ